MPRHSATTASRRDERITRKSGLLSSTSGYMTTFADVDLRMLFPNSSPPRKFHHDFLGGGPKGTVALFRIFDLPLSAMSPTFWAVAVAVLAMLLAGPLYAPKHVFSEQVMHQVAKNAIKKGGSNSTAIVNEVRLLSQNSVSPGTGRPAGLTPTSCPT